VKLLFDTVTDTVLESLRKMLLGFFFFQTTWLPSNSFFQNYSKIPQEQWYFNLNENEVYEKSAWIRVAFLL